MSLLLALAACGGPPTPAPVVAVAPPDDVPATARLSQFTSLADDLVAVRHPSDGGGRFTLVEGPDEPPVVGTSARWRLRYTAGPLGVAEGGTLTFHSPPFWGWSPPQVVAEDAPGFCSASTEAPGVRLEVSTPAEGLLAIRVGGAPLQEGATVDVTYGAGPAGARVDRFAERDEAFWLAVDGDGDGVRELVSEPVRTDVVAGPAVGLVVTVGSTARPGETVRLTVAALDAAANSGVSLQGEFLLASTPGLEMPDRVAIGLQGRATVDVLVREPGVHRIAAGTADGLAAVSNPLMVHAEVQPTIWADLQVHTQISDGSGRLDGVYAYARDVANLDAVAITDHDHWGMRFLDAHPDLWQLSTQAAERFHDPGRFVTFAAYEWTSWLYGHRHVLYADAPGPVISSMASETLHPRGLWQALEGHDALTIAHHSGGGPVAVDWSIPPDPRFEVVTEVCSVHGSSESADTPGRIERFVEGNGVRDALLRGYRLGLLCSTDGHDGHPGLAHLGAGRGGLAGLLTDDRTRAGIVAALRARRVYGTNGPRILLRVSADGRPMGSVLTDPPDPVGIDVRVVGTSEIRSVELIRGADVTARIEPGTDVTHHTFDVAAPTHGEFVYVRVVQDDGGAAWSSPIWFEGGGG